MAGYGLTVNTPHTAAAGAQLRVLDLFSGAGGLSTGLHAADGRFVTVAAVEHDPAAAATFGANFPTSDVHVGDISAWVAGGGVPEVDVVVGGPPCQGFSNLGKRDVDDERNQLWEQYARTLLLAQPQYFVVENVAPFMKSPQFAAFRERVRHGDLRRWRVEPAVLNAADYGAAQERRRAVLIGHHRDLPFPGWPRITHNSDHRVPLEKRLMGLPTHVVHQALPNRTTRFAGRDFAGVYTTDELHVTRHYERTSLERFGHIPEGGNRFDIPDRLLAPCWRGHTRGSGDVMGRLRWEKPSVTIRTEFFKPEKGRYLHPTEHRAITHHEAARIQGFPDDYKWVGSKVAIARQIGNAVPIDLGRAIGQVLAHSPQRALDA